jgi:conjugative relaxase-like TrwC/TraI family protein
MLTVSKALGAKQAKSYYRSEYSQSGEDSISQRSMDSPTPENRLDAEALRTGNGEWRGKLAEEMNLRGAVKTEQFERLCDGLHPETGEQLVRHAPVKKYTNRYGKEITTMTHRAGWDATFSAPKSVSLAAIVGGDERIKEAHRKSVYRALDEVEKHIEARIGGNNPSERTGKMISALFEHETARPDKALRYAAPQLHTHSVIFNVTETESGITKPIQPLEMYRTQGYATAVYRIELANRLQKLGYEIEIDAKTKAPEIKGFSPEYLKENSPRSRELQVEAEAIKAKFELGGKTIENDAGIRQIAAWQARETKAFNAEEMKTRALEMEVKYDFQAQMIYGQALENNSYQYKQAEAQQNAKGAIDFAKENAAQNIELNVSTKVTERRFLTAALENGIGQTDFSSIWQEYESRNAAGEFANLIKNERENVANQEQIKEVSKATQIEINKEKALENSYPQSEFSIDKSQNSKEINSEFSKENGDEISEKLNKEYSYKPDSAEAKSGGKIEKLSMDELENAVRQEIAVQKEVVRSAELILAI